MRADRNGFPDRDKAVELAGFDTQTLSPFLQRSPVQARDDTRLAEGRGSQTNELAQGFPQQLPIDSHESTLT
jgi:hypothetical protein